MVNLNDIHLTRKTIGLKKFRTNSALIRFFLSENFQGINKKLCSYIANFGDCVIANNNLLIGVHEDYFVINDNSVMLIRGKAKVNINPFSCAYDVALNAQLATLPSFLKPGRRYNQEIQDICKNMPDFMVFSDMRICGTSKIYDLYTDESGKIILK